jgi:hypothetical protein
MPKEQFSFVLVSEGSGEIVDIPWSEFLNATAAQDRINFITENPINIDLQLQYQTGGSAEHLETKRVTCTINGETKTKSLGTLPSKTFIDQKNNEYKMAIRQGNNLCFVKTFSSIYIPEYVIPHNEIIIIQNTKSTLNDLGIDPSNANLLTAIKRAYPNTITNESHIATWLNEQQNNDAVNTEELYKLKEFDFIRTIENYNEDDEPISFKKYPFEKFGIKNLYRINRLKVTHVQTGYSRLKPEGTSKKIYSNQNIRFYPGVEMQGEGMLIEMDCEMLNSFLNQNSLKIFELQSMVHSLSHCIMKELEFQCGYPLNSLKERLYFGSVDVHGVPQVNYSGVLIYSASGAESSFGGIAALFELLYGDIKLETLIKNAFERAQDCPNDPICIDEESNGNKGVCYSCNLLPETSCENFNRDLNRKDLNHFYTKTLNDGIN